MNFFIGSCQVENEGRKVPIIQDTCSASVFGTKRIQNSRIVQKSSKFQFDVFSFDRSRSSEGNSINCEISICLKGSHCNDNEENFPKSDEDCTGIEALKFKV